MVRSLSQWTKTLSFPSRLSPNRTSKELANVQPSSPGVSPTPSASSLPQSSEKTVSPIPITEISQIVSTLLRSIISPSPFTFTSNWFFIRFSRVSSLVSILFHVWKLNWGHKRTCVVIFTFCILMMNLVIVVSNTYFCIYLVSLTFEISFCMLYLYQC